MKANFRPKDFPDLFGNLEILPRGVISKNKTSKRKKKKTTFNNSGALSLFDNDQELIKSSQDLDREEYQRFLRMKTFAQNLSLSLNTDRIDLENKIYLQHPQLAENRVEAREYLLAITDKIRDNNGLIILPTGLGKTYLAVSIILSKLSDQKKKILFLTPTKPLAQQHVLTLRKLLPQTSIESLTGYTPQKKRNKIWLDNQIVLATPQTIKAELSKATSIVGQSQDLIVLIIDEIHHQLGNYDYVNLVNFYQKENPQIQFLGFTATPDPNLEIIKTWISQLKVNNSCVQVRSFNSPDVLPYTYYRRIIPHYLDRELSLLQRKIKIILSENLTKLILEMAEKLTVSIKNSVYTNQNGLVVGIKIKDFNNLRKLFEKGTKIIGKQEKAYQLLGLYGLIMVYNSALRALNSGLSEFVHFLERQYDNFSKEHKRFQINFCQNQRIQNIVKILYFNHFWRKKIPSIIKNQDWDKNSEEETWKLALEDKKLKLILDLIQKSKKQILVFTNYRDTLRKLEYFLKLNLQEKKVGILTGTSSKLDDPGMSQLEQLDTLQKFHQEKIDVLISTSVGEEGLDFPAVDTVIFYEPLADVRRYIQRLGRTARHHQGIVHILIYRETEEETLFYVSKSRERKVKKIIEYLQNKSD